jgi:2Fe-2S ferredoxin
MPRVVFEGKGGSLEVDAPDGAALLDVCDDAPRAPVPFACRSASCGSCLVEVRWSATAPPPPSAEESETLRRLAASPGDRLGCRLIVCGDASNTVFVRSRRLPG